MQDLLCQPHSEGLRTEYLQHKIHKVSSPRCFQATNSCNNASFPTAGFPIFVFNWSGCASCYSRRTALCVPASCRALHCGMGSVQGFSQFLSYLAQETQSYGNLLYRRNTKSWRVVSSLILQFVSLSLIVLLRFFIFLPFVSFFSDLTVSG